MWHPEYGDVIKPLKTFLGKATTDDRIKEWVVAWHQPKKVAGAVAFNELGGQVPIVTRRRRPVPRIDFIGSDRKHTTALLPIVAGEAAAGVLAAEGRGVVLIYPCR